MKDSSKSTSCEFVTYEMGAVAPKPPAHVVIAERDMPFWDSVVNEFSRSEWTTHQLEIAAFLARAMARCNREQLLLEEEGSIITNAKNFDYPNPREGVVNRVTGSILSLRRSLALNVPAKTGTANNVAAKREASRGVRNEASSITPDNLLAQPTYN